MNKLILGISGFYHDSAAAILRGPKIIAAAQEERFSRKKHDPRFPKYAINYCLEEAFVEPNELDAIVFYDNPILTWDRIMKNAMTAGSRGQESFAHAANSVLGFKIWIQDLVQREIGSLGKAGKLFFTEHHFSHGASAFYPSPFERAAILTLDGVGEWATTSIGKGIGRKIELLQQINYPHSLGLLYSAFTYFCGFKVNSGEYKLMGLAPYGEPRYEKLIYDNLIDIKADGSFRMNMDYFGYIESDHMINQNFEELFQGPPRQPESRITQREMDIARSVQAVLENAVIRLAKHAKKRTGMRHLVMAGGVALNCVANGKLLRERIFDDIWIQPAAGDAGGALGAALLMAHHYFNLPRQHTIKGKDQQEGSYLGPSYSHQEIRAFLNRNDYSYKRVENLDERMKIVATALKSGKIVGFFSGRMEFGPRALGARSIIGDPRRKNTQSTMNLKIKYRESFRPFAPSVMAEHISDYFEIDRESPYMLLVAPVKKERQLPKQHVSFDAGGEIDLLSLLHQPRSDIPAITHVDYSARIQSVNRSTNPIYHRLIEAFKEETGFGIIVNTSFNVRGEPIVCSPQDAYICFMRTEMDLLVLDEYLLEKSEQPIFSEKDDWRNIYELD